MTIKEIKEALEEQPEMVDLLVAYIEAKEANPKGVEMAMPIILKILTDGKKRSDDRRDRSRRRRLPLWKADRSRKACLPGPR